MMTDQEITQEQLEQLIEDTAYLQDEAEALKYVIDQVPYSETPPEGLSIFNMLKMIDHAQVDYFRPIIEKVFSENRIVSLANYSNYTETFEEVPEDEQDIQKVLDKIIKHRAGLLNIFRKITLIDWERELKNSSGKIVNLFAFANSMVIEERKLLKKTADLVLIYQNEKQKNREVNARIEQRKSH